MKFLVSLSLVTKKCLHPAIFLKKCKLSNPLSNTKVTGLVKCIMILSIPCKVVSLALLKFASVFEYILEKILIGCFSFLVKTTCGRFLRLLMQPNQCCAYTPMGS